MKYFDPKDYESLTQIKLEDAVRKKIPRQLLPFIRGPIPLWWVTTAATLPGKALAVGLALWYRKGLTKSDMVRPSWKLWAKFGIGRQAAYRALRHLETAGLVTVVRSVGKNPFITIITTQKAQLTDENP